MNNKKLNSADKYLTLLISTVIATLFLLDIFTPRTMAQSLLPREQIEAIVTRQARAWENQDAKAIADDFADDAVFIAAGFKFVGKQKIEQAAKDYFRGVQSTTVTINNVIIEENKGAVEWDWRDLNKAGKEGFAEDAIVFELAQGKIIYWREYIEKKKP